MRIVSRERPQEQPQPCPVDRRLEQRIDRRPAGPVHIRVTLDQVIWKLFVQREAQRGAK